MNGNLVATIKRLKQGPSRRLCFISHRGLQDDAVNLGRKLQQCYQVLDVTEESENLEVRTAYLDLAKRYHPDSGSSEADPYRFSQIEDAYKTIIRHRQRGGEAQKPEVEQMDFDIRHTAPQHRQYLDYEGVGFGSPSRRQRQYQQYRVSRANENVHDYRISKMAAKYETQLLTKDKQETRKRTIRSAMDRLVEDLITESMARGDFDNLSGQGQPLKYTSYNPMVDTTTHNLNRILIDNGYMPEWATLDKEIRQQVTDARKRLVEARASVGPEPLSPARKATWDAEETLFREALREINKKVDKLNLLVPTMWQQMMHFSANRELQQVVEDYRKAVRRGEVDGTAAYGDEIDYKRLDPADGVTLRDVLKELKALFTSGKS